MTTKPNAFENISTLFFARIPISTQEKELNDFIVQKTKSNPKAVHIVHNSTFDTTIGYIQFNDHETAKKVMELLNGEQYKDNSIGVSWCINDARLKKTEVNNVLIKNFKGELTAKELLDCCKRYGEVISLRISCSKADEKSATKNICFVKFLDENSVARLKGAKEELKKDLGDEIEIEGYVLKQNKTNLYVAGIGSNVTKEQFENEFKKYGEIKPNAICLFKANEKDENSPQFGYVDYKEETSTNKAIEELNESSELGSDRLTVQLYLTRKERKIARQKTKKEIKELIQGEYKNHNLYIKKLDGGNNLTPFINEKEVRDEFSKYGKIYSCRIKYNKENNGQYKPAGVAYVCFVEKTAADKAIEEYTNSDRFEVHLLKTRTEMRMSSIPPNPMLNMYGQFATPFSLYPFSVMNPNYRQQKPNKPGNKKNNQKGQKSNDKSTRKNNAPAPAQPEQFTKVDDNEEDEEVDEQKLQELGDDIYDYIEKLGKYDEEKTGKITGILLQSYKYKELRKQFDEKKLNPIIEDIVKKLDESE